LLIFSVVREIGFLRLKQKLLYWYTKVALRKHPARVTALLHLGIRPQIIPHPIATKCQFIEIENAIQVP
jgi:hypothetical protein